MLKPTILALTLTLACEAAIAQTANLAVRTWDVTLGSPEGHRTLVRRFASRIDAFCDHLHTTGLTQANTGQGIVERRDCISKLRVDSSDYAIQLAFTEAQQLPKLGERPGASVPNRFYMYGVVARLALLAAAYELEATDPLAETLETA